MAKIGLSEGFTLIPEGTHVFEITDVNYNEDFGKMEITLSTASGQKHIERFSLLKKDGSSNQGALNAFSYFAKTAMGDYSLTEVDYDDLIGHYLRCEVNHEAVPSNKNPEKTLTFIRLGEKEPATGFDETEKSKSGKPSTKKSFDLDSILGD